MYAIYARQSLDKKESISIETQIEICKREEVESNQSFQTYIDKGYSGKNVKRPQYTQMMKDVEVGKIHKIIVYRLDRLSRCLTDFSNMWDLLDKCGVAFVSVKEKFDTSTPMGRAMIYIIMVFAQMERETISERVKDNYYSRIKTRSWPGGPAPFGYDNCRMINEEGKSVPSLKTNTEIEVVKRIFFEYVKDDVTLGQIAKELSEERIPSKKRSSWDNVGVARILHSPIYVMADVEIYQYYKRKGIKTFSNDIDEFTGEYAAHVVGKRKASDRKYTDLHNHVLSLMNFAGVIPSDVWLKCQYKLERNNQIKNVGRGKYSWLTGLVKCAGCGYSLSIRRDGEKRHYSCSGRTNLHICEAKGFSISPDDVEREVRKGIEEILTECNQNTIDILAPNANKGLKMELIKVEEKISRLVTALSEAGSVSMSYINAELERLDAKKLLLEEKMYQKDNQKTSKFTGIVFENLDYDERKLVAQAFIEEIRLDSSGIEIVWRV